MIAIRWYPAANVPRDAPVSQSISDLKRTSRNGFRAMVSPTRKPNSLGDGHEAVVSYDRHLGGLDLLHLGDGDRFHRLFLLVKSHERQADREKVPSGDSSFAGDAR